MSADRIFLAFTCVLLLMQYYRNISSSLKNSLLQLSNKVSTKSFRNGKNEPDKKSKSSNNRNFRFSVRPVPPSYSRFDYPWISVKRKHRIRLEDSNGRILLSPNRITVGDGLGHAVSIHHAEISTAWRLGITYSHRTGKYASLTEPYVDSLSRRYDYQKEYQNVAAIENFFGWGSGEIPREAVQRSICPTSKQDVTPDTCIICLEPDRMKRNSEVLSKLENDTKYIRIDQVVEIPVNLSYHWMPGERDLELYRQYFLRKHNIPYTAFVMPKELCGHCPAYSKYSEESYNFYFNRYWDTHGSNVNSMQVYSQINETASFEYFHRQYTTSKIIPLAVPRSKLKRLKESQIFIAVHARRGDFFRVGRPMVPLRSFVNVIKEMISIIKRERDEVFSSMDIAIGIYSEGRVSGNVYNGHDIHAMNSEFLDANNMKVSKTQIYEHLRKASQDLRGLVEERRIKVHMRISEGTVLCLHEMIAADIFIGSESGLSQQLVSSLSRGAIQFLPSVRHDVSDRQVQFNATNGEIPFFEKQHAISLWDAFVNSNRESAAGALRDKNR